MFVKLILVFKSKPARSAADDAASGHLSDKALQEYSLARLPESSLAEVEEHLLICEHCRTRLERIEPVNHIHYTDNGLVYARVTRLPTGELISRHWSRSFPNGRAGRFSACGALAGRQLLPEENAWPIQVEGLQLA